MERDDFLHYFEQVRARTIRTVRCIPPDKIEWTCRQSDFTLGDLARHIAATEREVRWAGSVTDALAASAGSGDAAVRVDGAMVDEAMRAQAAVREAANAEAAARQHARAVRVASDAARDRLAAANADNRRLYEALEPIVGSHCPGLARAPYHVHRYGAHIG